MKRHFKKLLMFVLCFNFLYLPAQIGRSVYSLPYKYKDDKLQKLAEKGDADAAFSLSSRYALGAGSKISHSDPKQAAEWYAKATASGYTYKPDLEMTAFSIAVLFRNGSHDTGLMNQLGSVMTVPNFTTDPTIIDAAQAFFWFRKVVDLQGNVGTRSQAEFFLGDAYLRGRGVSADLDKAANWFEQAAQLYPDIAGPIGEVYLNVGQMNMALRWFLRGEKSHNDFSADEIGRLIEQGKLRNPDGTPFDPELAKKQFALAKQFREERKAEVESELGKLLDAEANAIASYEEAHANDSPVKGGVLDAIATGFNAAPVQSVASSIDTALAQGQSKIKSTYDSSQTGRPVRSTISASDARGTNQSAIVSEPVLAPRVIGSDAKTRAPDGDACQAIAVLVTLESKWASPKKEEVVGYFSNGSMFPVTCTWAFHKEGVWRDYGQAVLRGGDCPLGW